MKKLSLAVLGASAVLSVVFNLQAYFIAAAVVAAVVILVTRESASDVAYPTFAATAVGFSCYHSAVDLAYLANLILPLSLAFVYNAVRFGKRLMGGFPKTHLMNSMIAVAIAVLLGGIGQSESMSLFGVGAYYYLGLSVLPIGIYFAVRLLSSGSDPKTERSTIVDAVYYAGIVSAAIILSYYAVCIREALSTHATLSFLADDPVRNLTAIFLIPTSALSVIRAREKKPHYAVTVLVSVSAMLSSSRTAFLFTVFAALGAVSYTVILKSKRKKLAAVGCAAVGVVALASIALIYKLVSSRSGFTDLFSSDIRLNLWKQSLADFAESPIVGKGILYTGNSRYFSSSAKAFEIEWYHNLFAEVLGAFGVFGVLAYGYQLFVRGRICFARLKTEAELTAVYASMLLLSLTEPGIFCPFPTAALLTALFALTEEEEMRLVIPKKTKKKKTLRQYSRTAKQADALLCKSEILLFFGEK